MVSIVMALAVIPINDNYAVEKSKTNGWREIDRIEDTILYNFVGTVIKTTFF